MYLYFRYDVMFDRIACILVRIRAWGHFVMSIMSPHVKESKFRNTGNCCLWNLESGTFLLLESGIQLKESGIPIVCYGCVAD